MKNFSIYTSSVVTHHSVCREPLSVRREQLGHSAINLMFGGSRAVTSVKILNLLTCCFIFLIPLQKSLMAAGAFFRSCFAHQRKARPFSAWSSIALGGLLSAVWLPVGRVGGLDQSHHRVAGSQSPGIPGYWAADNEGPWKRDELCAPHVLRQPQMAGINATVADPFVTPGGRQGTSPGTECRHPLCHIRHAMIRISGSVVNSAVRGWSWGYGVLL